MREKEYTPLHADGFIEITEKELHKAFVEPFQGQANVHRTDLLLNFVEFWTEFKRLGLSAEVWIDGSFATTAPDPADIDMVFFMDKMAIENLPIKKRVLFEKLFLNKKFIRNIYKVEVYYALNDDNSERIEWRETFGTYCDNITPKGIFCLNFKK